MTTAGWNLGPTPDVAGVFNDTIVDAHVLFTGNCHGFLNETKPNVRPGVYTGDWNLAVANSTGQGLWGPPPPPPLAPPAPPFPPKGKCSPPVAGWSLAVEPTAKRAGETESAAVCASLCKGKCTGYTWHDHTCTGYTNACYITFDVHAWADGDKQTDGHFSGLCNPTNMSLTHDHANVFAAGLTAKQDVEDAFAAYFCGGSLDAWQRSTKGQDMHSRTTTCTSGNREECSSEVWLKLAREMLWSR